MDLNALPSVSFFAGWPVVSFVLAGICAAVGLAIFAKVKFDRKFWLVLGSLAAGFSLFVGFVMAISTYNDRVNATFHQALRRTYGLDTGARLGEVKNTAGTDQTIVMGTGSDAVEVRVHLDGDTLTFFRVKDGSALAPLAR